MGPQPTGMTRSGLSAMERSDPLAIDTIEKSCEKIDTCLRQLSKQDINLQDRFVPGKPRQISRGSFPEAVKAAKSVFSNEALNNQMKFAIGSHRRK